MTDGSSLTSDKAWFAPDRAAASENDDQGGADGFG